MILIYKVRAAIPDMWWERQFLTCGAWLGVSYLATVSRKMHVWRGAPGIATPSCQRQFWLTAIVYIHIYIYFFFCFDIFLFIFHICLHIFNFYRVWAGIAAAKWLWQFLAHPSIYAFFVKLSLNMTPYRNQSTSHVRNCRSHFYN